MIRNNIWGIFIFLSVAAAALPSAVQLLMELGG
jgi:hypothetical protein